MSRFHFRLGTLLRLREADRDARRKQLAEALLAVQRVDERLGEIQAELQALRQICRATMAPGAVVVDRLLDTQRYELLLQVEQHSLQGQRQTLEAEVQRRREVLLEANREVRVLEKLRETQAARFAEHQAKRELAQLDDFAGRAVQTQAPEEVA